MFCPQCKAEYREGFTRCSDCEVALVATLEEERIEEDPPELLWQGNDPLLFQRIVLRLRDAGVPSHSKRMAVHGEVFGVPMPDFEIRVFRSDLETGKRLVASSLEDVPTQEVNEGEEEEAGEQAAILPDVSQVSVQETHLEWPEEEAAALAEPNVEVWSGEDIALAEFMRMAFRENGIPYRTLVESLGHEIIFVRPQDKSRAREIVHEIVEGEPPR